MDSAVADANLLQSIENKEDYDDSDTIIDGSARTTPREHKDPFEAEDFDAIQFINSQFPNEESLSGIDTLNFKLKREIEKVDHQIVDAVRHQTSSGNQAREELIQARSCINDLSSKIEEIKSKSEHSETIVQEICRDIKKLDLAKRHLTTTIKALRRLAMLVSAIEQLEKLAVEKNYKEAANLVGAVTQLMSHFDSYNSIPKISEMKGKFHAIQLKLKEEVFEDFKYALSKIALVSANSDTRSDSEEDPASWIETLHNGCMVVDAMGPSVRSELLAMVTERDVNHYRQIFNSPEASKLENTHRRYPQIARQLRANEKMLKSFPPSWNVAQALCLEFCKVTKTQLQESLESLHSQGKLDVASLLSALQKTIEFEQELQSQYGRGGPISYDMGTSDADRVKQKYGRSGSRHMNDERIESNDANSPICFRGMISSCFEPHMNAYVDLEEREMISSLNEIMAQEPWDGSDSSSSQVLGSSEKVFLLIKKSLKRCSALTKGPTLVNLSKVFLRVLLAYASKLISRIPMSASDRSGQEDGEKPGLSLSLGGNNNDWKIDMSEKDMITTSFIINTAEYCQNAIGNLSESVKRLIISSGEQGQTDRTTAEGLSDAIDMSSGEDEMTTVINKALNALVVGIETKLDNCLATLLKTAWDKFESVGDQSDYVTSMQQVLVSHGPRLRDLLSQFYFRFLADKLASSFTLRLYYTILKCRKMSSTGAQQMLLDLHAIKTLLLEFPVMESLSKVSAPSGYLRIVNREMAKAEALLKVYLSSLESIAETYTALLPSAPLTEFQKLLDLRGIKRSEQQPYIESYQRLVGSSNDASGYDKNNSNANGNRGAAKSRRGGLAEAKESWKKMLKISQ